MGGTGHKDGVRRSAATTHVDTCEATGALGRSHGGLPEVEVSVGPVSHSKIVTGGKNINAVRERALQRRRKWHSVSKKWIKSHGKRRTSEGQKDDSP